MRVSNFAVTTILMGLTTPSLFAGTVQWDGGAGNGLWSAAANWDGDAVPAAADDVLIIQDGTYTVTLDVNVTVASLTLGSETGTQTLALNGRTLTLNGASVTTPSAQLSLTSSTINGSGSLSSAGTVTSSNSIINVPLVNDGTLVALFACGGCNLSVQLNAAFTNNGLVNLMGGGNLRISNNGADNYGTIQSLAPANNTATMEVLGGTLTNHSGGVIRSNGAATSTLLLTIVGLVNDGFIDAPSPLWINEAGPGWVPVDSTAGSLGVGSRLTIESNIDLQVGASTTLSGGGTLAFGNSRLSLDSDFTQPILPQFDFSAGSVTVQALAPATPTYTIGAGATLPLFSDVFQVPLVNDGTLVALFACGGCNLSVQLNAAFTNNGLVNLMGGGNLRIPNNGADNYGTIQSLAPAGNTATMEVLGGTLTNHQTGTLRSAGGAASRLFYAGNILNLGLIDAVTHLQIGVGGAGGFLLDSTNGTLSSDSKLEIDGNGHEVQIGIK